MLGSVMVTSGGLLYGKTKSKLTIQTEGGITPIPKIHRLCLRFSRSRQAEDHGVSSPKLPERTTLQKANPDHLREERHFGDTI